MNKAESRKDTIKEWLLPDRCKFLFHRLPRAAIFTEFKKLYKQTTIKLKNIKNLIAAEARYCKLCFPFAFENQLNGRFLSASHIKMEIRNTIRKEILIS